MPTVSLTNEEDGEGDKEQEDMGNQVESIHETAIVQHALPHAVGTGAVIATKWQGHATTQCSAQASSRSVTTGNRQNQSRSHLKMNKRELSCKAEVEPIGLKVGLLG